MRRAPAACATPKYSCFQANLQGFQIEPALKKEYWGAKNSTPAIQLPGRVSLFSV
jgi:hypothetical protein